MKNHPGSWKIERRSTFAVFSLLVAAFTLALGVVLYLHPSPPTAAQEWSNYHANQASYTTSAYVALTWSVFSIPFVVGLGTLLRVKSRSLALAATLLSAIGVLPGWLAVFGLISGIASFAPPFRFVQAIVLDSFMLWSFITGIVLLRSCAIARDRLNE